MHRFFCPHTDFTNPTVVMTDPKEIHHLKNVLRLKEGDGVIIFDGKGNEATAAILSIAKDAVHLKIADSFSSPQKKFTLSLACAIPKKAKFETIIEKITELGVDEIIPLLTDRTEVRFTKDQNEKKRVRYETIAINAAKQSSRTTIPRIYPPMDFKEAIHQFCRSEVLAFIPCLSEKRLRLFDALKKQEVNSKHVLFFIGPEGDFTKEEIAYAVKNNCLPVSLGENVLKVDTAAISVVAFAKLLFSHEK